MEHNSEASPAVTAAGETGKISNPTKLHDQFTINTDSIADINVRIQVFRKTDGNLTKSISLNDDDKIVKDSSQCSMWSGVVQTMIMTPREFASALDSVEPNIALALSNSDYTDAKLVTPKHLQVENAIHRALEYFKFINGFPSYVLFDVDFCKEYPPKPIEEVYTDIESFIPEFKNAGKIIRPSTSSGILIKGDDTVPLPSGWHIYCVVKDAAVLSDLKTIKQNLLVRAFNAGVGYIKVSLSGSALVRCPIDLAVFSPERLIFEASPILSDDLEKVCQPAQYINGGYIA